MPLFYGSLCTYRLYRVYKHSTCLQPVVKLGCTTSLTNTVVQPFWQPVEWTVAVCSTGCQTSCTTGITTGCIV